MRIYRIIAFVLLFLAVNAGLYWLAHSAQNEKGEASISVPPTPEGIRQTLAFIEDPELGINIMDLGLVRNVEVTPDKKAVVTVLFTSTVCPLMDSIMTQIAQRVKKIKGIRDVEVNIDKTIAWNKDMMTENGKRQLEKQDP